MSDYNERWTKEKFIEYRRLKKEGYTDKMLKQHFKQSQFIIVSLKDGMFNNANVLFRTKFVDGSSAVTRTTCNQK